MKKIYLLMFLLVSFISYTQTKTYNVTISNLSYRINKGVKNSSNNSKIRITIFFESGPPKDIYLRQITEEGDNENGLNIPTFPSDVKPISFECYAKVNFRTGDDADGTVSKTLNAICPSGSFDESYSRRMDNIKFNYKVEPVFHVTRVSSIDDFLPTHSKKTMVATSGYDASYYKWQYTLFLDGISTIWTNLLQYNNSPSITVDAVDILGVNAGLNIGKNIYFRIKPCTEIPGMSTPLSYSIRLSAPKVNSLVQVQPTCIYNDDGSVQLVFDRTLLDGEQLNYTLFDEVAKTPTRFKGVLAIDANKAFSITGLPAGIYTLQLIGFKDGLNTSVDPNQDPDLFALKTFEIIRPTPVDFSLTSTNVNCYDGKDGTLTINASGGTEKGYEYSLNNGVNWIAFKDPKSTKEVLSNLFPVIKPSISYSIIVRDKNGCIAKVDDNNKVLTETISEPLSPLAVTYTFKQHPTFSGAFNGKITASISGGTIKDDKSYDYKWVKTTGEEFTGITKYNAADKTYSISIENVPDGEYKLTVTDKNYANATNKSGCSIIESTNTLVEPKPIKINLKVKKYISCNSANLGDVGNSNEKLAADGILTALVEGGKILKPEDNNGLPYYFYWKKQNSKGEWDDLGIKDSIAPALSAGTYSVNVEDANGIMHGTYTTTEQTPVAVDTTIVEPDAMKVEFSSTNVSCFEGQNGWAKASIKDGKSTYTYTWYGPNHNGVEADEISNLVTGMYHVDIVDKDKGCFVKDSIYISQPPSKLNLEFTDTKSPTFFGATNGKIVAKVTGGTHNDDKTYDFVWKNKAGIIQTTTTQAFDDKFIITLDGIPAGEYILTVTDKNYKNEADHIINCSILDSVKVLKEPAPLKIKIEVVRTISCNSTNEFGNAKDTTPKDGQRDESQDGILIAHVSGGVTFSTAENNGLPYKYFWKKLQPDNSWKDLGSITDSIASNLSQGKYAVNVEDSNGIVLGIYVNDTLSQRTDVEESLIEPAKLTVTITKGDVYCKDGNDGWATATASGGTEPYYFHWSNDVKIDKNTILKKGEYWVFVTDGRGCTTQESIIISEPTAPLAIKYKEVLNPSFYKATNGKIVVEITGGTIFSDNSYWFEWKNSKGKVLTTTTTNFNNGIYTISLNELPEETYSLTIRDRNYNDATSKKGCTVANSVTTLDDPDPLEVTFEVVRTISCNVSNEFGNETDANPLDGQRDESQDGILVAKVKGGIQLAADKNNGLPYFYTWKKLQKNGSWAIWNDHDETAENISDGTYALNIEDANKIKLGRYVNNVLVKEIDVTQEMPEPAKLSLTFTKFDVGCTTGDDGWAEAHVSGGTSPYEYEWTNEATTPRIDRLTTNNYFVKVTDAKGCVVQGSIFVGDPNGIVTTETITNPICFESKDGSIVLNVSGGNLPYTYLWNTGATTKDLTNVKAGNYEVAITCPDCCVYKKRFVLKDPNPIVIDLGKDRTLCNDQILDLDATIADKKAQYNWTSTNGFTSNEAKVSLTKSGTYHVKVTSGLGCIGEDDIVIKTNQVAISSEFLLSSQAYLDEEVILVNTSNPFGESTKWMIPKGVKIVEEKEKYITLKFDATGVYSIGLEQTQGECYATYSKSITVEQRSTMPDPGTTSKFITDFIVTPNPSNGNFAAIVNLENNSAINLRLFSTTGQFTMTQKKDSGKKKYEVDFNTSLESGMYILVLETEQQTLVKKIIIY